MKKILFYEFFVVLMVTTILLTSAQADGFWDQGFKAGTFRTDFDDPNTGLWFKPLIQSNTCLFPPEPDDPASNRFAIPCIPFDTELEYRDKNGKAHVLKQIKSIYPKAYSFYWPTSRRWPTNSDGFWVLSVNNETVTENFNLGPPNQSLPVMYSDVLPWQGPRLDRITKRGTMNIAMELRGNHQERKRIHLALNTHYEDGNENFSNDEGSIPFLGFGAIRARGNKGKVLGMLNDDTKPHTLKFTTKMWGAKGEGGVKVPRKAPSKPLRPNILSYMVLVTAEWGGMRRGIFLQLFHRNQEFSCPDKISVIRNEATGIVREKIDDSHACNNKIYELQEADWNWPIQQSYFSPGIDLAYIDAEDLRTVCEGYFSKTTVVGNPLNGWRLGYREESTYDIDLQELFNCVQSLNGFNEPMPDGPLPITGIQWTLEASGVDGLLWTSLESMEIH